MWRVSWPFWRCNDLPAFRRGPVPIVLHVDGFFFVCLFLDVFMGEGVSDLLLLCHLDLSPENYVGLCWFGLS